MIKNTLKQLTRAGSGGWIVGVSYGPTTIIYHSVYVQSLKNRQKSVVFSTKLKSASKDAEPALSANSSVQKFPNYGASQPQILREFRHLSQKAIEVL